MAICSVVARTLVLLGTVAAPVAAQPKDQPSPVEGKPAEPAKEDGKKDDKKPKKGRAPKVAKDAKEALDQARFAMQDWAWIQYDAKVEGVGITGEYTAKVTLEQAEAGGWKISVEGELKGKGSTKGRPIRVAYDGAAIRSIRTLDKEVGQLTDPADVEETMLFFAKERAAGPIAWESITPPDGVPFAFADKAEVTLEPAAEVGGEMCNIVRIVAKDAKPAGEGADAFGGVYAFSAKDGVVRRIERFRPNAKPGDKPLRTVTFTNVETSATVKGGEFALQIPSGFRVKTEAGKKAIKPIEKSKEEVKKPAKRESGMIAEGKDAPKFDLKDSDGNKVSSADLKGKVVVLDFWATWCGPCLRAMPTIQKVADKYAGKDVVVLGMHTDSKSDSKAKEVATKAKASYTIVLDAGDVGQDYGVGGIPALVVIGKDGKVIGTHVGFTPTLDDELSTMIDKGLAAK
jgi:thiol-disulfide isomerase/thioredoxin